MHKQEAKSSKTSIPLKELKALKDKIKEEARHMVEEASDWRGKQDPLENLEVEVYSHNAKFTGKLTPVGVEAIKKALGKS